MPRKLKLNADWFIHDVTMSSNRKILAIEQRFGIIGYALFNKFLEEFAGSDHCKINYDDLEIELLAGKFKVESQILKSYIEYCVNTIKIYTLNNNMLFYPKLNERLQKLFEKREKIRERVKNTRTGKNTKNELQNDCNALQNDCNALRYTDKIRIDKKEEYKYSSVVGNNTLRDNIPIANQPTEIIFIPPSLEEVKSFVISQLPKIRDPDFTALNYYTKRSNAGWYQKNNNKITNWQLDLITWVKNEENRSNSKQGTEPNRGRDRIYESDPEPAQKAGLHL